MITKLIFAIVVAQITVMGLPEDDEVDLDVPGYHHQVYSGFLDAGGLTNKKKIHYVLCESQKNVAKDPILVWFTGGPGCSSLAALLLENGPFVFKPEKHELEVNENAWNKRANVLYLELPAGVGFSEATQK